MTAELDLELVRATVRQLFSRDFPPRRIREMDQAHEVGADLWQAVSDLGWFGLGVPPEYGGAGAGCLPQVVLVEESARHFASFASAFVVSGMNARFLADACTTEQKQAWLPGFATGQLRFSFAISEPGGGTDALAMTTRARLDDEWRIDGEKLWTSFANRSDFIILVCRTDPADPPDRRARGISLILVPSVQPGLTIRRVHLAGMRAAGTCQLFFDDARAPAVNLLGERGRGFYTLLGGLNVERILAAAISLGISRGALDDAIDYAKQRTAFGRPIGAFQSIQHPLAESAAELEAARLLVHRTAERLDAGEQPTKEAAMAKVFAAEVAVRAVDRGMRTLAAHGLAEESDMQRHFRDARLQTFSPISNEMAKNVIGEQLGLPRTY